MCTDLVGNSLRLVGADCMHTFFKFTHLSLYTIATICHAHHISMFTHMVLGCWGESYCMDVDMRLCNNVITDMRMLMTKGSDEKKWMWSDAGKHHLCTCARSRKT